MTGRSHGVSGHGPGLAISKRLVSLMYGQIGVRSVLGQGSEFWFHVQLMWPMSPCCSTVR